MGQPKGGKDRKWTQKEKLVEKYLGSGFGRHSFAKTKKLSSGTLYRWVKQCQETGYESEEGQQAFAKWPAKKLTEAENGTNDK